MARLWIVLVVICSFVTGCGHDGQKNERPQTEKTFHSEQEPTRQTPNAAITWKSTWHDAAQTAKLEGRDILLLFTNPDRCPPCQMMEEQTWPNPEVAAYAQQHFVPLKIHTGRSTERTLGNEFEVMGIPTTVVCDAEKHELARKTGFVPPAEFLEFCKSAASLRRLQKAVETKPDNLDAILELAKAYQALDRIRDAVPLLEKICSVDQDNADGKKVSALHLLGTAALAKKNVAEAKDRFTQAAKLDPNRQNEYADDNALHLALLPAHDNDLASAASALDKFISEFPDSSLRPQAFLYQSQCYAGSDDKDAARKTLEKLLAEYPDTPEAGYAQQMIPKLR